MKMISLSLQFLLLNKLQLILSKPGNLNLIGDLYVMNENMWLLGLMLMTGITCLSCRNPKDLYKKELNSIATWKEYQLTDEEKGHFLNQSQVFSPDDRWIVFDNRNDDSHIGRNSGIAAVAVNTKELISLYRTKNQTIHGPGAGAAAFHPQRNEVIFIHGLSNADSMRPYSMTRRTAVSVDMDNPGIPVMKDARDISPPFTDGALRGGTHAYSYSGDGEWISFTYNDYLIEQLALTDPNRKDLRSVGILLPRGPVHVTGEGDGEHISGKLYAVIIARVTEFPVHGSDEIEKACEEGWVGKDGYLKADGTRQSKALAFLGDVRDNKGDVVTEIFLVDLPDDLMKVAFENPVTGTATSRPVPPRNVKQKRLTYTADLKYPGVQGPRQWLRSLPDGSLILFPMKDDRGLVQIFGISPNGGDIKQLTDNDFSLETSFSVSPDGSYLAYGYQQDIYLTTITNAHTVKISPERNFRGRDLSNINWSNDGEILAYNRKVLSADSEYYQVFMLKREGAVSLP